MKEVARILHVCTATVYALCDAGKLQHTRVANTIRVSVVHLNAYLASVSR